MSGCSLQHPDPRADPPAPFPPSSTPEVNPAAFAAGSLQHSRRPVGCQHTGLDWVHLSGCWREECWRLCTLQSQVGRGKGSFPSQRLPRTTSHLGFISIDWESQGNKVWGKSTQQHRHWVLRTKSPVRNRAVITIPSGDTLPGRVHSSNPAKTSSGYIPVVQQGQTQSEQLTSPEQIPALQVWIEPLFRCTGTVLYRGKQDLAGLSSSVPALCLCVLVSCSPAPSLGIFAKPADGREVMGWDCLQQSKNASSGASPRLPASGEHLHTVPSARTPAPRAWSVTQTKVVTTLWGFTPYWTASSHK